MYSQPKRFQASHWSLQQLGQLNRFITIPDSQGIQRNVPVNDQQLQDVMTIIQRPQMTAGPFQVQGSFGSLPSATSAQSVLTTHSLQASLRTVSTGR